MARAAALRSLDNHFFMRWQKAARVGTGLIAVACAVGVGLTLRQRPSAALPPPPVTRTDEKAVLESAGGFAFRVNREREELRIEYEKMLTYEDGSSRMIGVKVTTEREQRTFTINGAEGHVGQNDSTVEVVGNVLVATNDGLLVTTDRATFTQADGLARAPGAVSFSSGRMSGTGVGFTYDKNQDILTILDQAALKASADEHGSGAMEVSAGALEFRRNEHSVRFERSVKAIRPREVIEADTAVAHLSPDEKHLESIELRGQSRINVSGSKPGGLQSMTGRDIDVKYAGGAEVIEHAVINGDAVIQLAGEARLTGRQLSAAAIDVTLAADGATPTALSARENVRLNLPAEPTGVARTIASQTFDSMGDASRGLTTARFVGGVQYAERGASINRAARAALLDISLKPGFGAIEDAVFTRGVRFVDGAMTATAAQGRYVIEDGTLALSGSESGNPTPHVVNDRIMVDATTVDVTLDGPILRATGTVKSMLQPQNTDAGKAADLKMPSMLKQDQPVNITSDLLDYSGKDSRATYKGTARLWQGETLINASTIVIDSQRGDLEATGPVATVAILQQQSKDGRKERVRSVGAAQSFAYQDVDRRATYTGEAHLSGPPGDLTAERVELFLRASGDELERVEAYDNVTLRSDTQKTTGTRLTYFDADGRYLVNGAPVTVADNCDRETTGRTLTFFRATDRIIVDGKEGIRTQTKGKSNCPGS